MPYKFDDIGGINNSFSFTSEIGIVFIIKFKPSPYFLR
jgi:hypothetical protein